MTNDLSNTLDELSAPYPICDSRNARGGAEYEDAAYLGCFYYCRDCGHFWEVTKRELTDDYLLATPYPVVAALMGDVILWLKKHDQYDGDPDDIADQLAEAREEAGAWNGAAIRMILAREGWENLDAEFAAIIDGSQALETAVAEAVTK